MLGVGAGRLLECVLGQVLGGVRGLDLEDDHDHGGGGPCRRDKYMTIIIVTAMSI